MPSRPLIFVVSLVVLSIASLTCAAIAWSRRDELALPLPTYLPALNVVLPVLTAAVLPVSRRLVQSARKHALRLILPYMAYASTMAPFTLFILSLVYAVPSDLQSCAADQHWLRMFENKDERAIRTIQTRLQCCGYNSMRDRAWPFPSRGIDAGTCQRTQGYTTACGDSWHRKEAFVAGLSAVASLLNWLVMILIVFSFPQDKGQIRLPAWSPSSTRLIEEGRNDGAEGADNNDREETATAQDRIREEI